MDKATKCSVWFCHGCDTACKTQHQLHSRLSPTEHSPVKSVQDGIALPRNCLAVQARGIGSLGAFPAHPDCVSNSGMAQRDTPVPEGHPSPRATLLCRRRHRCLSQRGSGAFLSHERPRVSTPCCHILLPGTGLPPNPSYLITGKEMWSCKQPTVAAGASPAQTQLLQSCLTSWQHRANLSPHHHLHICVS